MAQQRRQQNLCLAQSRARETREGRKTTFVRQLLLQNQKSEYKIINDFANGKAQCVGHTKGKSGEFAIDISFERLSPLANGVMPLMKNKDGSFRNPLYSEKDFFKATGTITLNGKTYKTNERSVGIIDDHKGYYPFFSHYDWLTTMGKTEIDGEQKFFAFNLTRNQSVDQVNYNENVIWLEGESFPMPPVVFTHKDGKRKRTNGISATRRDKGLSISLSKSTTCFICPFPWLFITPCLTARFTATSPTRTAKIHRRRHGRYRRRQNNSHLTLKLQTKALLCEVLFLW